MTLLYFAKEKRKVHQIHIVSPFPTWARPFEDFDAPLPMSQQKVMFNHRKSPHLPSERRKLFPFAGACAAHTSNFSFLLFSFIKWSDCPLPPLDNNNKTRMKRQKNPLMQVIYIYIYIYIYILLRVIYLFYCAFKEEKSKNTLANN
jgi:hypothetical protein